MSSTNLPTIVFAPGAWHDPSCFDLVTTDLESRGFDVVGVTYPSVGAEPPNKGLSDDAAAVRSVLENLVEDGKEVVLVVHSYGGLVGSNAVEGLGYRPRIKEGKNGGVIMFVYLSAFVNAKGTSLLDNLGNAWLPWMLCSEPVGEMGCESGIITVDNPKAIMYHDVGPDATTKALAELKHQSAPVFSGKATYEPWHDIDCMYFFCEDDVAIPIAIQEMLAQRLPESTLKYRSKTSHSPFLSRPQDVVEALIQAAKAGQDGVRA